MSRRRDFIKNTVMAGIGVTVLGKDGIIDNEDKKLKKSPQENTIKSNFFCFFVESSCFAHLNNIKTIL